MNNNVVIPKSVIIYGVCVPLAMLMGYLLTTPLDMITLLSVMLVLGLLLVPIFLKWHHAMLIVSWNAVVNAFFLPGQPRVWMVLACASLGFSILQRIMNKKMRLLNVRAVTLPLIALTIVILVTAQMRGGIGLTSMGGGSFGGRKYFEALLAILGFFALSWQKIPPHRAALYVGLFFLAGLTHAISNLAYASGVYWLFWIFPVDYAVAQIQADYSVQDRAFLRLSGVAFACMAPFCFVLARYGVRGSLDFTRNFGFSPFRFRGGFEINQPWRLMALIGAVAVSTYGGFRSVPVLMGLIFIVQFFLERLYKTKLLFMLLGLGFLTAGALLPFSDRLPLGVQRAISFLPVKVNPSVSYDAWASTDWRLRMWNVVLEELPKYLWLGKGYGGNASDLALLRESRQRGFISDFEGSYIAGDYHSGPLSVLLPLGVWGAAAFLWFLVAGLWLLYRNFRWGPSAYYSINLFLFSFFVAQVVFYMAAYGAFTSGLAVFTGTVGLSISLNGGVCGPVSAPVLESAPAPQLPDAQPVGAG